MSTTLTNIELGKLNPTSILELFILDATALGIINDESIDGYYRFHAGTNGIYNNIIFDSQVYYIFPIEAGDFEITSSGNLPRPKLRCANINGYISNLLINGQNLIGAKITRRRVFVKFIDAINFPLGENPYGTPNPDDTFSDDIFYINRKVSENSIFVEFELASQLEVDNVKLPSRKMLAKTCMWRYRCEGCAYTGEPITDKQGRQFKFPDYPFSLTNRGEWSSTGVYNSGDFIYLNSLFDIITGVKIYYVCKSYASGIDDDPKSSIKWEVDYCDKTMRRCSLTFSGINESLRFGGFPGLARVSY